MTNHERDSWIKETWPTTIICDRYGGAYSGGKWTAFPLHVEDIDPRVSGDDVSCGAFWGEMDPHEYGVGDSPQGALEDLKRRMADTGEWTEDRCPKCGSHLLGNRGGERWCSFVQCDYMAEAAEA